MMKSPDFKVLDVDPNNIPPVEKSHHIRQEELINRIDEIELRLNSTQTKLAILEDSYVLNLQNKTI